VRPEEWIEEHGITRQIRREDCGLDYDLALLREMQRRVYIREQAEKSRALQLAWHDRCQADFRVFRDNWLFVDDERRRCIVPSIARDYQDEWQAIYLGIDGWRRPDGGLYQLAVKKARMVGATVTIAQAVLFLWLLSPSPILQTLIGLKLDVLDNKTSNWGSTTFSKLRVMIAHLPKWLRPQAWRDLDRLRFVDRSCSLSNPSNGALIEGKSADASDKAINRNRGRRSFRCWIDEAAQYTDLTAVVEAYQKDGEIVMTSTVGDYTCQYSQYFRGEIVKPCEKGDIGGIVLREAHYTQIPDYDPATEKGALRIEAEKASTKSSTWRREMEMDDAVTSVGKIWEAAYDPARNELRTEDVQSVMRDLLADDVIWIECFDFGQGTALTSWLVLAVVPRRISPPQPSMIYAVDYLSWSRGDAGVIADAIAARGWRTGRNPNGREFTYRVCDPSGSRKGRSYENGRARDAEESWIHNLAVEGIVTMPQGIGIYSSIDLVLRGLSEGRIVLFPACTRRSVESPRLPCLKECVLSYAWDSPAKEEGGHTGNQPAPKKNRFANGADALQFGVWRVWAPATVITKSTTTST